MKDNSKIKTIYFFDFDSTLVFTTLPEEGKKIWKQKTGNDYPHDGWWGKEESLDTNVFNIEKNPRLYTILKNEITKDDTFCVLLTSRLQKLKPSVLAVLKKLQLKLDDVTLKTDSKRKSDRVVEYVKSFPNLEKIVLYDDMDEHISDLKTLRSKLNNLEIDIYRVNNTTLISESVITDIVDTITSKFI